MRRAWLGAILGARSAATARKTRSASECERGERGARSAWVGAVRVALGAGVALGGRRARSAWVGAVRVALGAGVALGGRRARSAWVGAVRVALGAGVALGAVVAFQAPSAHAEPRARLVAEGRCPAPDAIRAALRGVVDLEADREAGVAWTIAIGSTVDSAELVLRDRGGAIALTRRLASRDCKAKAKALAIIVEGFFRRLAELPPASPQRPSARGADEPGRGRSHLARRERPATSGVTAAAPVAAGAAEPPARSRPVGGGAAEPPGESTTNATPAATPAAATAPARGADPAESADPAERGGRGARPTAAELDARVETANPGIELGFAAGAAMSTATGATGVVSLDGGGRLGPNLTARVQLTADTPSIQEPAGEPVELQRGAVAAGLAYRIDAARAWFRPALLAGASFWRIAAQELEGHPTQTRLQPTVGANAAAGLRIAGGASLRLDLGATVFLSTDRYVVVPDGEIARSPRILLTLCLGVEWASFP